MWNKYFFAKKLEALNTDSKDYLVYAIFCLTNSLFPIFLSPIHDGDAIIIVRFLLGFLCILLLLHEIWPQKLKKYLGIYWNFTLMYTLPLYSVFIVLNTDFSKFALIDFLLSIFVLTLLVDWIRFIILLSAGMILGVTLYIICYGNTLQDLGGIDELYEAVYILIMLLSIAYVFIRRQRILQEGRLHLLRLLAGGIAHELRTPLASLLGNINLLKRGNINKHNHVQGHIIENMIFNLAQCHRIIDSILLNLKANHHLQPEKYNIYKLVQAVISEYPLEKQEKQLIDIKIDQGLEFIVDSLLVKQVLVNLVKNALYSIKQKGDGKIYIYATKSLGSVQLIVQDTGMGIAPQKQHVIFEPFESGSYIGSGIGLAFSKYVIEKMHGTIECDSIDGQFSKFIIKLPTA